MSNTSLKPDDISTMVEKSSAAVVEPVERTLERYLEVASVKSVYNKPVQHGENMIIPAAEVVGALGFGMGAGMGAGEYPDKKEGAAEGEGVKGKPAGTSKPGPDEKAEGVGSGGGGGGGGGGYVFARPVAVVISGPDGVRVEPVVDPTKIALAFFTALGFMFSMAVRMRRPPRR